MTNPEVAGINKEYEYGWSNPERYAVGVREAMGIPRGRLVR